jgi:hypothetical protein
MRKYGLSDQVRSVARDKYVLPAMHSGRTTFTIKVRSLLAELAPLGFPANSTPLVCNALRSERFLGENGLEIVDIEGPPSKLSTTVVMRYRLASSSKVKEEKQQPAMDQVDQQLENPAVRAKRLVDSLRGLLKEEMKEHGGAESFVRWIRSDDGEAA